MQEESESPRKKAKTTVKEIKTDGGDEEEEGDEGDEDEENEDDDKNDDDEDDEEEGDEVSATDTQTTPRCLPQFRDIIILHVLLTYSRVAQVRVAPTTSSLVRWWRAGGGGRGGGGEREAPAQEKVQEVECLYKVLRCHENRRAGRRKAQMTYGCAARWAVALCVQHLCEAPLGEEARARRERDKDTREVEGRGYAGRRGGWEGGVGRRLLEYSCILLFKS